MWILYEVISKKITLEDILQPNRSGDIIGYDLSSLTIKETDKLMRKSLETGKDLLFELCKDKKIVITLKMQREAWEKSQMLIL